MVEPSTQYRCTIITRGRAQGQKDDLLPAFASVINNLCPCHKSVFDEAFDKEIIRKLSVEPKTAANYRTETAGQLFGMYYIDSSNIVHSGKRTEKLIEDNDQPAFFKDVCYKLQVPSGINRVSQDKTLAYMQNNIRFLPCPFLLSLLRLAEEEGIVLTKKEMAYYALNSLEVLRGESSPVEVLNVITRARRINSRAEQQLSGSRDLQHINEIFNLMYFANLIRIEGQNITINSRESTTIEAMVESLAEPLPFDVYQYDLSTAESRKIFRREWSEYYAAISDKGGSVFDTSVESLVEDISEVYVSPEERDSNIGDEGERWVYFREKARVKAFNERLARNVLHVGAQQGLGYDVQSVIAGLPGNSEHKMYIEVKTTKRVTAITEPWKDQIKLEASQWIAAEQLRTSFWIFRVYWTNEKSRRLFRINDPYDKYKKGLIHVAPIGFRVEFKNDSGEFFDYGNGNEEE